jgi:steroid delta-isomerase-like uncharacterized protein
MGRGKIDTVVKNWLEAWQRRDVVALAAAFAEDAVYTSMLAGTIRGRPAIEALYRSWFTAFPQTEFVVESRLVDGDNAAVHWSQTGTHTGEFCGLAGSGRIFILPGAFFMTFRNGKITNLRSIYDFTGLLLQIGILKAKPVM